MIRHFDPTTASDADLEVLARLGLTPSIRALAQAELDERARLVDVLVGVCDQDTVRYPVVELVDVEQRIRDARPDVAGPKGGAS